MVVAIENNRSHRARLASRRVAPTVNYIGCHSRLDQGDERGQGQVVWLDCHDPEAQAKNGYDDLPVSAESTSAG